MAKERFTNAVAVGLGRVRTGFLSGPTSLASTYTELAWAFPCPICILNLMYTSTLFFENLSRLVC